MGEKPIRLLIAEDNGPLCEILKTFFSMTPEVELCGTVGDGESALKQIARTQPDVLLLDIIMPSMDGLAVLEKLRQTPMEKKPFVIVTSAVGQEAVTNRALSLGASYYMIKPYNLPDLLSRVCLIASREENPAETSGPMQELRPVIARKIIECGMTTNTKGYQYCIESVDILARSEQHCPIVKEVYWAVARKYETTPQCVESALRQAIRRVYQLNNAAFQELVRSEGSLLTKPPSNGRFLTMLSERIKMDIR